MRGLLLAKRQQEQRGEWWGERGGGKVGKAGLAVSAYKEPGHRFTSSGVTEGSEPGSDVVTALCSGRTTSGSTEGSYRCEAAEARKQGEATARGLQRRKGLSPGRTVSGDPDTGSRSSCRVRPFGTQSPLQALNELLVPEEERRIFYFITFPMNCLQVLSCP